MEVMKEGDGTGPEFTLASFLGVVKIKTNPEIISRISWVGMVYLSRWLIPLRSCMGWVGLLVELLQAIWISVEGIKIGPRGY